MKLKLVVDLFALVIEAEGFEVFIEQKLSDILNGIDNVAQTKIELGQEVAVQLIDADIVVKNDICGLGEVIAVLLEKGSEGLTLFLLFEFYADD